MADKVYQLPYDDVIDKDISDWLKSLPRSRKAEIVRNALRFYMQSSGEAPAIVINPSPIKPKEEENEPRRRPSLPKDGDF